MPMYNLIEYSDNYSKTSGSLWQYCKEIPAIDDDGDIVDFNRANATDSFNFKTKITGQTAANNNDGNIAKVTYENITKITIVQLDDYTTGCLLDYTYFKKHYKMITIDLSKQQVLDADPKSIQQINFTANLDRANTRFYFILEEAKETVFEFS